MSSDSSASLIPVTLLTGFLGSGKTTVLNHLVRQPELADALVIINEFGEMALDHMLVAHSTENLVMEMDSGCVCCSIRGDLVKTLQDIAWRFSRNGQRQFQRVLIETTGLADPAPIIHTLMTHPRIAPKYRLDGIVTTVDFATGMHTLDQHKEAVKQAAMADALLLTKSDLATEEQRDALLHRLSELNPAAPRWLVQNGEISAHKLLNLGLFTANSKTPDVARWLKEESYTSRGFTPFVSPQAAASKSLIFRPQAVPARSANTHPHDVNRHNDHIHAFCFAVDEPIPEDVLTNWLEVLMSFVGSNILRVKGILNVEGQEQPIVVHGVQHIFHPPVPLPAWPSEDRRSRLVFITQDVGRDVIEKTFRAFRQVLPQAMEPAW
jgi:G3E family GTPase